MLCGIALRLRWNVVRDSKGRSEEGLLAAHVAADFLDDVRRSIGPRRVLQENLSLFPIELRIRMASITYAGNVGEAGDRTKRRSA